MVTGLRYDDVPDFVALYPTAWSGALQAWLASLGMSFCRIGVDAKQFPPSVPVIAIGPARSGRMHAILYSASTMHDPSPRQAGFAGPIKHRLAILPLVENPEHYV